MKLQGLAVHWLCEHSLYYNQFVRNLVRKLTHTVLLGECLEDCIKKHHKTSSNKEIFASLLTYHLCHILSCSRLMLTKIKLPSLVKLREQFLFGRTYPPFSPNWLHNTIFCNWRKFIENYQKNCFRHVCILEKIRTTIEIARIQRDQLFAAIVIMTLSQSKLT